MRSRVSLPDEGLMSLLAGRAPFARLLAPALVLALSGAACSRSQLFGQNSAVSTAGSAGEGGTGADGGGGTGAVGGGGTGGTGATTTTTTTSTSSTTTTTTTTTGGPCETDQDCEDGQFCTTDACQGGVCVSGPRDD